MNNLAQNALRFLESSAASTSLNEAELPVQNVEKLSDLEQVSKYFKNKDNRDYISARLVDGLQYDNVTKDTLISDTDYNWGEYTPTTGNDINGFVFTIIDPACAWEVSDSYKDLEDTDPNYDKIVTSEDYIGPDADFVEQLNKLESKVNGKLLSNMHSYATDKNNLIDYKVRAAWSCDYTKHTITFKVWAEKV